MNSKWIWKEKILQRITTSIKNSRWILHFLSCWKCFHHRHAQFPVKRSIMIKIKLKKFHVRINDFITTFRICVLLPISLEIGFLFFRKAIYAWNLIFLFSSLSCRRQLSAPYVTIENFMSSITLLTWKRLQWDQKLRHKASLRALLEECWMLCN